jgi:hypothetical protein
VIDTVRQRATAPNFNAIAACFGTANLSTILAHLNRGILRAKTTASPSGRTRAARRRDRHRPTLNASPALRAEAATSHRDRYKPAPSLPYAYCTTIGR